MNRNKRKELIEAYEKVRKALPKMFEDYDAWGICAVTKTLRWQGEITQAQELRVNSDVKSVIGFKSELYPYYFKPGAVEPRLKFIDKRIKELNFWSWLRKRD